MRLHQGSFTLLFPVVLLCLVQCSPAVKEQPVTAAECTAFAKKIESDIKAGDKNTLNRVLDIDLFAGEVAKAAGVKKQDAFVQGVKQGFKKQNISREILSQLGADGSYEFVNQYEKEGRQHMVFRLMSEEGINYHDYDLVKTENKVAASDMFIFMTGEKLSRSMANLYATVLLDGKDAGETSSNMKVITNAKKKLQDGDYQQAQNLMNTLPPKTRKDKLIQIINLQIASKLSDEEYLKALAEYEAIFGNEANSQLVLLDGFILHKEYGKAQAALNKMDNLLHDPMLDYYRGILYSEAGKPDSARSALSRLIVAKPAHTDGWVQYINLELKDHHTAAARQLVSRYKTAPNRPVEKLEVLAELYPEQAKAAGLATNE